MNPLLLGLLALLTSGIGALGGLGGAVLLVPLMVVLGLSPAEAAPIGLLSVGAGTLTAGIPELREGLVHHRLGVSVELGVATGTFVGAFASAAISARALSIILAVIVVVAALAGAFRKGIRNRPDVTFVAETPGEWPGTLGGTYRLGEASVPYQARRLLLGLPAMLVAGVVAGLSGVGGGFLKTPAMTEVMHVPVKVAAATATFSVGITAASGLIVYASQGRIDTQLGAAAVLGGLLGGSLGARLQGILAPTKVRRALSVVLVVVAVLLVARS